MKVWVIGRGGLLGRSVESAVSNSSRVFVPNQTFAWHDSALVSKQIAEACKSFFDEVGDENWTIYWCAGRGTLSSLPIQMAEENQVFAGLMKTIESVCSAAVLKSGTFFYASSAGAVYAGSSKPPFTELTEAKSLSAYGDAKLHQEALLKEFANRHQVRVLVGRISNLYGARQDLAKNQGLISTICYSVLRRQPISLFVPLETSRNYIYIDDAAKRVVRHTQSLFNTTSVEKFLIKLIIAQDNLTIGSILKIATSVLRVRPLVTISANKSGSTQPQSLVFKSVVNTNLDTDSSTGFTVGVKRVMSDLQSSFLATGWQNTSEKTSEKV